MEAATKTAWAIDTAHSEVHFKVKHMMVSTVTGAFDEFEGKAESSSEDFTNANIEFSANIDSINTKNGQRDGHLKSEDFFNAEKFPKMTFKSTKFTKTDEDEFELIGDLTIRDVTKSVKLEVEFNGTAVDPYGNTKAGFEIKGKINRKDFGLKWGAVTEAGSVVVGDQVKLDINIQLIKQ